MTIATDVARSGPYAGAGTTGPFTVGFRFLANTHLQVVKNVAGVETTLTLTTHYSVAGAGAPTGTVTLVTALAVGETLTIIRNVPFTQEADYVPNDPFSAESHEQALDKLTMETQQLNEKVARAITAAISTPAGVSLALPPPVAFNIIGWNGTASGLQNTDPSGSAALAADLASKTDATKGSALVGHLAAGAGAAGRTAQAKLRDIVSCKDFAGVDITGATDSSPGLSAGISGILTALGGGVVSIYVPADVKLLIDTNLALPDGVSLIGPWTQPGELLPGASANYDGLGGQLKINSAATITLGDSAAVKGLVVLRKGLDLPFADAAAATAGVAAFAGTAFTIGGADAYISNLLVLGFTHAIKSSGFERLRIENVSGDCTNGIDITTSLDISHVEKCHFWPFTTVHQSWTTGPLLQRTGTAYKIYNTADFIYVVRNFAYGYSTSYYFENLAAAVLANKADNVIATAAGRIGFETRGNMNNVVFDCNHADSHDVNYRFAHTAGTLTGGVNTSGQSVTTAVQCGAASSGAFGQFALAGSTAHIIRFETGIGRWSIDSVITNSTTTSGVLYLFDTADLEDIRIGWTTAFDTLTTNNLSYGTAANPGLKLVHGSKTGFFVNSADGTLGMSVNGFQAVTVQPVASAVNSLKIIPGSAGQKVTLSGAGEANITMSVVPTGTGGIQLAVPFTTAAVAQTGYITILDDTGTARRLLIG